MSNLEDELHQSQDALRQTLASIEDGQKKMAEELTQVRCQLETLDSLAHSATASDPRSSTPDPKKKRPTNLCPPRPEYASVTGLNIQKVQQDTSKQPTKIIPGPRRKRNRMKIVTGTQECEDAFHGAPEVRSLFISNVTKETQLSTVEKYLHARCNGLICVRKWSHPDAPLQSFKVTVPKESVSTLLSDKFHWPERVRVRRFIPRRGPPPAHVQ